MSENIQEVLEELHTVRPDMLDEKGKRLFEAIMKIADERDKYKDIIKEVREKIEGVRIYSLRSGKTFIATLLNDILEILEKAEE